MAAKFSFGNLHFELSGRPSKAAAERDPEAPFALAILGDFSGRSNRGISEPLAGRAVHHVDCDNFEAVMARIDPRLRLPAPPVADASSTAATFDLRLPSLDHFHPDRLLKNAAPLAALFEQRGRLLDPSTSAAAAAELQALMVAPAAPAPASSSPKPAAESDVDTLQRLLGGAVPTPTPPAALKPGGNVNRFLDTLVASSVVPAPSPGQTALLSSIELELAARLRGVLHHPDFQSLEASWRGVDLLVRNFGAEEDLKLFLVDVSKAELAADLQAQEALDSSGLHRLITREADQLPWTIWAGLYTFDASVADVELLGRLAKISADTGAPFFAGASAHLVSCDSFGALPDPSDWKHPLPADARDAWQLLRSLPEAAFLGLALPRFLLRQPYGKESDPVESFPFEEMPADPPHEDYLWGNPALLCAFLIASEFQAEGWEMRPGAGGPVGELPVHKFKADGESKVKPCAEAWLSDRAGDAILKTGLMPVLSIKGRDEVRLPFLRSVAGTPFAIGHGG